MTPSPAKSIEASSPAVKWATDDFSKTAAKLPKPKLGSDMAENNTRLAQDVAQRNCITFVENNPSLATSIWMHIEANFIKVKKKVSDHDPTAPWNSEHRNVWRLPVYWRGMYLQSVAPQLKTEVLGRYEQSHVETINNLFYAETGLKPKDPLPRQCLDKEVCMRTMVERSRARGGFLASLPESAFTSDRFDFIKHGLNKLAFAEGKLTALKHWGGADGTIPGYLTIMAAEFVLVDNHLEFGAHLKHTTDKKPLYLASFFADGTGPHQHALGTRGAELVKLAIAQETALAAERAKLNTNQCSDDLMNIGQAQKAEVKKRALEAAREKVKLNKKMKLEAKEMCLSVT